MSAGDASFASTSEFQEQLTEQNRLITQLKDMIRQKDKELVESTAKLSKVKLQAKAKITSLTGQLEDAKKGGKEAGSKVRLPIGLWDLFSFGGTHIFGMFCLNLRIHARIRASPLKTLLGGGGGGGLCTLFAHPTFSVVYSSIGIGVQCVYRLLKC